MISTRVNDFLALLVAEKCITPTHRDWIIGCRKENKDVFYLFEIIKRRSFQNFIDFRKCLAGAGQKLIVDVLRKGGVVVEITNHLKGIESRKDLDTIEKGIIEKLSGYVGNKSDSKLNEEQTFFIDKLIAILNKKENRIKFVGSFSY